MWKRIIVSDDVYRAVLDKLKGWIYRDCTDLLRSYLKESYLRVSLVNNQPIVYVYQIDKKWICSLVRARKLDCMDIIQTYIKKKKARLIKWICEKLDFNKPKCSIEDGWERIKRWYKRLMEDVRKCPERVMASESLKRCDLQRAGVMFYFRCEAVEPPWPVVSGRYYLQVCGCIGIGIQNQPVLVGFEIYYKGQLLSYIGLSQLEFAEERFRPIQGVLDKRKGYIIVNDKRIIECLKFRPSLLDVGFTEIQYFKWAVRKVLEKLVKMRFIKFEGEV